MASWAQIRGLSYGTMGRTVRGTVHASSGATSHIWFAPPTGWRVENADGTPAYIENESDEYHFGADGVVHMAKAPNRLVAVAGLSAMSLLTAYRMWPPVDLSPSARVGEPIGVTEADVRGRRGWEVEFDDTYGGPPIRVVIDAELGLTISWSQGEKWLEMETPTLDEAFDSALFTWDGPTVEFEEHLESLEQQAHDQHMLDLQAMPATQIGWAPAEIFASPVDGDPLLGALDVTVSATSVQFGVRRWLIELGEPTVGFAMEHLAPRARATQGPWTVEVRSYNEIDAGELDRIIDGLVLPEAPGTVDDLRAAASARQQAASESELIGALGTGRKIDDYLANGGGVSLLIRTDFTSDDRWREIVQAALKPVPSGFDDDVTFEAGLTCVDHPDYRGLTPADLVALIGEENPPFYAFIADPVTMEHPESPIQVVDCGRSEWGHEPGRAFRVIPSEVAGIENNLSISNMDFRDFADAADDDGVFRGFPPPPPHVATYRRDELLALAATNQSTPTLIRFADELTDIDSPFAVITENPRSRLHTNVVASLDPARDESLVGLEEYLAATAREALCHAGSVQIPRGYWAFVVDPESGRLEAAMCRQVPPVHS